MKKTILFILSMMLVLLLASCASTSSTASTTEVAVAEDAKVEEMVEAAADDWWDNPPSDTDSVHYEVGVAKGSTTQISRDWAKSNAGIALAQYVSNTIDAVVVTYLNDAGEVGTQNMQAVQAFESLSKQNASATISGVQYKYKTMDDGTVYVLASLPIGQVAEALKENVKIAFERNEAANEANEMMNEAIKKYFASEE